MIGMTSPANAPPAETAVPLSALADLAGQVSARLEGLAEALAGVPDALVELLQVGAEVDAAADAHTVRLTANLSDRGLLLLAALRAGEGDLRRIEIQVRHALGSLSGVKADTGPRPGESDNGPAGAAMEGPGHA